ncbi:MAG: cation transporter [Deltaproteobacteria bacterium]|nr:cation transporter [Deltaproteobacteria bacterium]
MTGLKGFSWRGTLAISGAHLDRELKKRFKFAAALTGVTFLAEAAGGYLTNSLALMSDAMHVFMDLLALSLSLFAIYISGLPPSEKRTYGLHRGEVFVSFINGMTLVVISLVIFYKAYFRFLNPQEVKSAGVLIIAAVGLAVNVAVAVMLKGFAGTDLNVKSAFLHVVGDAVASVGVIAAAIVISFTGLYVFDPAISAVIGVIILYGSVKVVIESSHILLEGVPADVDFNRVAGDVRSVEGVAGVHSLHIWSICHNIYALSAHLDIDSRHIVRRAEILKTVNERLAERHHIFYTTIQAECPGCEANGALRDMVHREYRRFQ